MPRRHGQRSRLLAHRRPGHSTRRCGSNSRGFPADSTWKAVIHRLESGPRYGPAWCQTRSDLQKSSLCRPRFRRFFGKLRRSDLSRCSVPTCALPPYLVPASLVCRRSGVLWIRCHNVNECKNRISSSGFRVFFLLQPETDAFTNNGRGTSRADARKPPGKLAGDCGAGLWPRKAEKAGGL